MFVLAGVVLGVATALLLGGRPARILQVVRFRYPWLIYLVLAAQVVVFLGPAELREGSRGSLFYLLTLGLLLVYGAANLEFRALIPVLVGAVLNTLAIAANGGTMPVSPDALAAAGIAVDPSTNIGTDAQRLWLLGDIFALPRGLPVANVFSIGDILIVAGTVWFIVVKSFESELAGAVRVRRLLAPLRVSEYRRLAAGSLISRIGDWLTLAALVGWTYDRTESTSHVAALMLLRLAPPILGGGAAAVLADRLPKTRLLVGAEALRGTSLLLAVYGVLSGHLPFVFAALALSGLLAAASTTTVPSLVPELLDEEDLPAANAGLGVAQDVALALGALTAGVTLSSSHVVLALVVDLVTFAVAAALYATIRSAPRPAAPHARAELGAAGDSGLVSGLRYVLRRRVLVSVILAFGVATLATGLTNASLPSYLDGLGLGGGAYGFGLAALGAGLVLGQAVTGLIRMDAGGARWMPAALGLMGLVFACLAYTEHALTALFFLALLGFLDGTTDVIFDTVVQREADPRYMGRVFGLGSAFFTTTMMLAVAAAPLVHALASSSRVMLVAAACVLLAAVVAAAAIVRREPGPARVPEPAYDPLALRYLEPAGIALHGNGNGHERRYPELVDSLVALTGLREPSSSPEREPARVGSA